MLPRSRGILFTQILRVAWLVGIFLLLPVDLFAEQKRHNVVCRNNLSQSHREELIDKLKKITGWSDLMIDHVGMLRLGIEEPVRGSQSARELLTKVIFGPNLVILEDASKDSDVVFARVIPGKWPHGESASPPAFIVQIDFADFEHVRGDNRALQAFNVGWALLHELDHIINDSLDTTALNDAGECETNINKMRRECNLPHRAEYFFTFLPLATDTAFITRLVRLAFDQEESSAGKKKRYWLVWDANLVGGLDEQKQIAALR